MKPECLPNGNSRAPPLKKPGGGTKREINDLQRDKAGNQRVTTWDKTAAEWEIKHLQRERMGQRARILSGPTRLPACRSGFCFYHFTIIPDFHALILS